MYKLTMVAAVACLFAGSALAGCIDDPRSCMNSAAGSYCKDNPQACLDHPNSVSSPSVWQRLIERLREAQPKLSPSDTAGQPKR